MSRKAITHYNYIMVGGIPIAGWFITVSNGIFDYKPTSYWDTRIYGNHHMDPCGLKSETDQVRVRDDFSFPNNLGKIFRRNAEQTPLVS